MDGPDALTEALARVRLVALDVDGTLTEGRVTYIGSQELMSFCARDGQGLRWLSDRGVRIAWITGRGCEATVRRANELGIDELRRGGSKETHLREIQGNFDIDPEETLAMGDDLPDLGLARAAGIFCAPCDAAAEVRERADLITRAAGGRGAVREIAEMLLRAKGLWEEGVGPREPEGA
ncbi:MAG TPA: hypothetical protein ENJ09_10895 [Planctomycetes bacterium]|nr:hypothetical protein [Planctomycetota bacterium]